MRSFDAMLGGRPVTVYAPEPGSITAAELEALIRSRAVDDHYGLDVESLYMDDLGQWAETFGLRLLQLAPNDDEAYVLTLSDPAQLAVAVALLADVVTSYVSHTQMDVLSVGVVLGVDITARNVDTRALANAAYTDKRADRSLKALATMHGLGELAAADVALGLLFQEMYRAAHPEVGKRAVKASTIEAYGWAEVPIDHPLYLVYAGLDAIAVRRLEPLLVKAGRNGPRIVEVEVWLAGRANRIQLAGMLVDQDKLAEIEAEAGAICDAARTAVFELTGGTNPKMIASPKIQEWLAEHGVDWSRWVELGGPVTEKGNPSLADNAAAILREFDLDGPASQVVSQLITYKGHQDRLTRAKGVRSHLAPDGRIHPVLVPNGATTTSRMSSAGPNMQNFSANTRGMLIPDPGHVLVSFDLDQVELRVGAGLAREEKMIEVIHAGGDLHSLTAELINRPRPVAKPTNFLIVYGGGAPALRDLTGLPLAECSSIIRDWRAAYPRIDALAKYLGLERDAVYTISGRRLPVTYRGGEVRTWANINYAIQSAARELLVDAWMTLDAAGYGHFLWYPIHDELVLQVPEARVAEVLEVGVKAMTFDFNGVPITAGGIVLRDREGVSRWMDGHEAEEIAQEMGWAA
jgi:DNA polymerase I-like protein with 3'-5' exonuclease and polymerase domains